MFQTLCGAVTGQTLLVKLSFENRKALVAFLPDATSQAVALVPAETGEQVLGWDEEVVEYTLFQMGHKVLQKQAETLAQTRGPPVRVFSSGAAGVEQRGFGVIGTKLFK